MKAINNKKQTLPYILMGLLALNASWQIFSPAQESGSWASTSGDVRRKAIEICQNRDNDISLALTHSLRQKLGEFYFKGSSSEDLTDTIKSNGQQVDISYNGRAEITRITETAVPRSRIERRSSDIADNFSGTTSAPQEEAPETKLGADGKPLMQPCADDASKQCEVKEIPLYHVFAIQVHSQTTEGDWCDDCSSEQASGSSETRYIEVKVSPNPSIMTEVCQSTFEIAQSLFVSSERAMKKGIEEQLKEIAELAEQEELEDLRADLIRDCRIKRGASIDDVKEYKESGSIRDAYSYKGQPEEKMSCLSDNLADIKSPEDRAAYFRAQMLPMVQGLLTSADPMERKNGMDLLMKMRSGEFGRMTPIEMAYINSSHRGAQKLNEIYTLTDMVERMRGTPQETEWQMRLDNAKMQADLEYQAATYTGSIETMEEAGFWHSKITGLVSTTQYNTPFTAPMGPLNLAGRGARLAPGHDLMGPSFEALIGNMPQAPGYLVGGVDSISTDGHNPEFRPNANLPGAETGVDRMARARRN